MPKIRIAFCQPSSRPVTGLFRRLNCGLLPLLLRKPAAGHWAFEGTCLLRSVDHFDGMRDLHACARDFHAWDRNRWNGSLSSTCSNLCLPRAPDAEPMELNIHSPLPGRKDFRIGVLGAGFIVSDCHLVAYRKAGFNPVAIASRTRAGAEKVAQRHGIARVYDTPAQLLDDPSIEVLDIAVPPMHQLGLIEAACRRKTVKGILAQKPLGMNHREAVQAVAVCDKAGIVLAVNDEIGRAHV